MSDVGVIDVWYRSKDDGVAGADYVNQMCREIKVIEGVVFLTSFTIKVCFMVKVCVDDASTGVIVDVKLSSDSDVLDYFLGSWCGLF